MKTYARIQDGLVAELLQTSRDITAMFCPELIWIEISSHPEVTVGWHYDGTRFTAPPQPPQEPPLPTIAELQTQIASLSAQLATLSKSKKN